jgi:ribonuclease HI/probable phosphoglycerate mutase
LHFDESVCKDGCGVGVVIISPSGAVFEALNRLDHDCTNNQTEYEALLFGLEILHYMGVKHVEAYGDSLLVVQQVSKVCQCLNGFLNAYLDKCLDMISCMDQFVMYHVPREENPRANALAQQTSGYNVRLWIKGLRSYPKRCVNLLIPLVLNCSIHLHTMLKPMVKLSLATKLW